MVLIRKYFVITIYLVMAALVAEAQSVHYKIIWRGDSVGYINAYRFDSINFEVYKLKSEVSFWFFGRRFIKSEYSEVFKDQQLISSETRYFKDDKLREKCSTIFLDSAYDITLNGIKQPSISDPIKISTTTLLFKKPEVTKAIYSERFGVMMDFKKINDSSFRIEKANGRFNVYSFENEICKRIEVDNFFATLFFVRIGDGPNKNL